MERKERKSHYESEEKVKRRILSFAPQKVFALVMIPFHHQINIKAQGQQVESPVHCFFIHAASKPPLQTLCVIQVNGGD